MQFPESAPAGAVHKSHDLTAVPHLPPAARDADAVSPSLNSRRLHVAGLIVAVALLAATAGIRAVENLRPLDVQLSGAMHRAGDALQSWQDQLARGLQVSLRAVADGRSDGEAATAAQPAALPSAADRGAATQAGTVRLLPAR